MLEPSLAQTTLAEFLGETGEFKARGRMRALLHAKNLAERAARELEVALADGSLTEERSLQLERTVAINERRVAKKLALRAADELRRMLDTGKVDVRRSQWLEQAVEKGLVVVLEDARRARTLVEQKKIDVEKFAEVKERLSREHAVLNEQAMRLRGMWDEDEEGYNGASAQELEKDRRNDEDEFDGFRGNV